MKRRSLYRQRGVAVVTALLLTTLAVTIVASLFWQQQVQVRSMENQRLHLQTRWILRGALDWARLVLRQDWRDNPNWTTLDAVWNTPLMETRLDQYIERDRMEGETFDATISGRITDASSRYNLANLSDANQLTFYRTLLRNLQIDESLAQRTFDFMQRAAAGGQPAQQGGAQRARPLPLTAVDDLLAVEGYTLQVVDKLRPFVIVLPESATKINVNTAPAEILGALMGKGMGEGAALAAKRKQLSYWRDEANFKADAQQVAGGGQPLQIPVAVNSEFFLAQSRIKLDRAALNAEALIRRKANEVTLVWIRQN
ncbi:MAG TPA: type II secretion system minor pseudopilin GspK [Telluria sp.]|nr:type II secretion system minor pseudopilin GspK [Telluria sp.]